MRACSYLSVATCVLAGVAAAGLAGCSQDQSQVLSTAPAANPPVAAQSANPRTNQTKVAQAAVPSAIAWEPSFEAALKKAKATNKPVMIDFNTKWCGWCKELDRTTYTAREVVEESQRFVNVKVDGDERSDLAARYRVKGYPAIIWTDSTGNQVDSFDGYAPAEAFVQAMRNAYVKFQPALTA